jgi:diguanylate cyclase (GGDEF)-like protein/PAS domain S-box-containing protein
MSNFNLSSECTLALKKLNEAVIIHNEFGEIIQFNQSALNLLGVSKEQLLGKFLDELSWQCINEFGKTMSNTKHPVFVTLKTQKEVLDFKMGVLRPDKKVIWISVNSYPIIRDKKLEGVLVTFFNKTELNLYKDRFELALNSADIGVCDWNLLTNEFFISKTWKKHIGYEDNELVNSFDTFKELLHPKDISSVLKSLELFIKGKKSDLTLKYRLRNKLGEYAWFECEGAVLRNPESEVVRFIAISQSIDNKMQNEIKLRQSATIFDSSHDSIMITDANNIIVSVNKSFEDITGYSSDEIIGKSPRVLKSGKHDSSFYSSMYFELENKGAWQGEIWNKTKSGDIYPEWLTIKVNKDSNNEIQNYICVFSDMSDLKGYERKLYFEANHDSLTGLINRKRFYELLDNSLLQKSKENQKTALAFMDLDKFKYINDTYGHDIGDKVLIEVSRRLKNIFTQTDYISRLSGDEFGFILNNIQHENEIKLLLNHILEVVQKPIKISDNVTTYVGASIGIALYPDNASTVDELMKHADIAMYKAKDTGNSFCFFDDEYTKFHKEQLEIYNDLKIALKDDQIDVYFQPQIDIRSKTVTGIEALARWKHPQKGYISPEIFIKVCEEFGLIDPLTDIIFEKSLSFLQTLQNSGFEGKLYINISPKQLKTKKLVNLIKKYIDKYNINTSFIGLEITENAIIEDIDLASRIIDDLKLLGIAIAIDDFGTGSTSLRHLQNLKLDKVKIDKSFIDNITKNEKDQILVKSMIQLCENLGLEILIEGVELEDQLNYLVDHNCTEIQGYYFSKPLNKQMLEEFLKSKKQIDGKTYCQNKEEKSNIKKDSDFMDFEMQSKMLQDQSIQLNMAEFKYKKIYEEFNTIFDLAPIGYAIIDKNMQIINANKYLKKLTKHFEHDFFNLYFDSESRDSFIEWFNDLNYKSVKSIKLTCDNKNLVVKLYGIKLMHENEINYFISMLDITKEINKKSELKLFNSKLNEMVQEQTDKNIKFQEEYIQEKIKSSKCSVIGQMAAGLTHEINTPLTIIKGNLQLLESDINSIGNELTKKYMQESLDNAYGGINRISFIVNTLRELSDNDKSPQDINIYSSLLSALAITQVKHKHTCNILIQNELFSMELDKNKYNFMAKASHQRIEQVWVNIINNAMDELIKINDYSKRKFIIDISEDDNYINVVFRDNAGGISKNILENIFEPFVSTKSSSGIGLGLFLSKKIIDEYNGFLDIESIDKNTVVKVGLLKNR